MSKTLLNAVNDTLKRMGSIKGNSGELVSLADSQRQVLIDLAVSCINETVLDIYMASDRPMPNEVGTTNITLVAGDRDYTLPTDMVAIRWPLINESNGYAISEYPSGWEGLVNDQLQPSNFIGRPTYGVIRPTDGLLYLDMVPTSADNGLQYKLYYDKSQIKSLAADTMPFSDDTYLFFIPAVVEKVKMERDEQSDAKFLVSNKKYQSLIARCAKLVTMSHERTSWLPTGANLFSSDPMED